VTEIHRCLQDARADGSGNLGVTLGICDSDSSIVYYKVYNGLVQPDPPSLDNNYYDNDDVLSIKGETQ
jgi:hypothetical protein